MRSQLTSDVALDICKRYKVSPLAHTASTYTRTSHAHAFKECYTLREPFEAQCMPP